MMKSMTILITMAIPLTSIYGADIPKLDSDGCRVLSKLPETGVHPRVFFTSDEYPLMKKRLSDPRFRAVFDKVRRQVLQQVKKMD